MKIKFEVEGQEVEHEVSESLARKIQSSYLAKRPQAKVKIAPPQVPIEDLRFRVEIVLTDRG